MGPIVYDNYDDNKVGAVKCFRDDKPKTKEFCPWAKSERRGYFLFLEIMFLIRNKHQKMNFI